MSYVPNALSYNTKRGKMHIPEYGRNVQRMIEHAKQIEDREVRNSAARAIIDVMGQINPHLRDVEDYTHKLWTHLFVMADFDLDVDSPYPIPEREKLWKRPDDMEYPKNKAELGHFGFYAEEIIKKIAKEGSEEEHEFMLETLGNMMKKNYLLYHTRNVENAAIANYLSQLSNGKLKLEDPKILKSTKQILKEHGINPSQLKGKKTKHKSKSKRRKR